jgi:leucyl-tRNA synthetase
MKGIFYMEINFAKLEKKWQNKWEKEETFKADNNSKKPKYYCLEMFPYPSGDGLHMGHSFNFTLVDILARFKRLSGFNVMYPVGYDSLGLPAENAAIKNKTHPKEYTDKSIPNFKKQQKGLGLSYDWSRLLSTANPEYYKWDQWIFLKMFEKNLAYQKTRAVNWCPKCKTVLANEQAQTGKCDRCDTKVTIKHLEQWFLKITNYANELYEGIKDLDWPETTKAMQKNWIGKSHGTQINFKINKKIWPIFTTRPDTIHGVTFMVVSAQHEKLKELVTEGQKKDVEKFLKKVGSVSEKDIGDLEKEGVFTGSYAINPINNEKVPVYAGNFVVADYGAGMVMAVPAHDQRDFEFAKKYDIKIIQVIDGEITKKRAYTGPGKLINSDEFDDLYNKDAKEKITKYLSENKLGKKVTNFKLRDWGISRQRYWGTPIPIIHCEGCGAVPVKEYDLPVKLPYDVKFGKGNPLETNEKWVNVKCPKCKGKAKRETDTMDTFVNSSWYFFRYADPNNNKKAFNKKKVNHWCPIDTYIGGAEHACMHLIYSRFFTKFLNDSKLLNFREPIKKLYHQGMINDEKGQKMSKSKGNVTEPLEMIKKYGADVLRFFTISVAAPDKGFNWDTKGINGSSKFINKIFEFFENYKQNKDSEETENKLNKTITNVTKYYDEFEYRKATIEIRELFDLIIKQDSASKETLESALKLLNPICPHITEELFEKLGNKNLISTSAWPKAKSIKKSSKNTEDLNEKIISQIETILEKVKGKENIFVYVMPFELGKINKKTISSRIDKKIEIYATNDKNKHDPENKAKKAHPGMASIYLE